MEDFERCFERNYGDIARFCARPRGHGRGCRGRGHRQTRQLEVTVKDGLVRRVRAGAEVTEYLSLGEPQSIERP